MKRAVPLAFKAKLIACLRGMRINAGLTQAQLAAKIDQPQSYVSKYELGEKRLDLYQLKTICKACGVKLAFFITTVEDDA